MSERSDLATTGVGGTRRVEAFRTFLEQQRETRGPIAVDLLDVCYHLSKHADAEMRSPFEIREGQLTPWESLRRDLLNREQEFAHESNTSVFWLRTDSDPQTVRFEPPDEVRAYVQDGTSRREAIREGPRSHQDDETSDTDARFPTIDEVIDAFRTKEDVHEHVRHNLTYWSWIHGGLSLVRQNLLDFDPRQEYWYKTERRVLVAYFASRFDRSYAPADALREVAFRTFLHFERAREDGQFGEPALASAESGLWAELAKPLLETAKSLPDVEAYGTLRPHWRKLRASNLRDDLVSYLEEATDKESVSEIEPGFQRRMPWFPYCGIRTKDELLDRQRFFYGLCLLFTSTNAYYDGGSLTVAPILQNNSSRYLISFVERWTEGENIDETGFDVAGKSDERDRSHITPIRELHGFLTLHQRPFYNRAATGYQSFARSKNTGEGALVERIGIHTREYLKERSDQAIRLAQEFRSLVSGGWTRDPPIVMEGIRNETVLKRMPEELDAQADTTLRQEVAEGAQTYAHRMSDLDAAATLLHLMLDAAGYKTDLFSGLGEDSPPAPEEVSPPEETLRLPRSLRTTANDALGYLRAGRHVLLAGPPGTGKTIVAQFVGEAWNRGRNAVRDEIPRSELPATTVGNSAWAPFHTIGGILPDGEGRFRAHRGIFIDPEFEQAGEWRLRPDCLVLDEMNRADLDRCIGELYPLLSASVDRVHPAGIPHVAAIRTHPHFRLVATVNDATLDDVVFPISEGLARRFVRIELRGATREDLEYFFSTVVEADEDRFAAAEQVIEALFDACEQEGRLMHSEVGEHLPFGVGYFGTLKAWLSGKVALSEEFEQRDVQDKARLLLRTSLSSAARMRGMDRVLDRLETTEEPT